MTYKQRERTDFSLLTFEFDFCICNLLTRVWCGAARWSMLALLLGACANFTGRLPLPTTHVENWPRTWMSPHPLWDSSIVMFVKCNPHQVLIVILYYQLYIILNCYVKFNIEVQHRDHLLGKRHWTNHRWKEEALKSIYVRGFNSDTTTEEDIRNVFSSFGVIHRIFLDSKVRQAVHVHIISVPVYKYICQPAHSHSHLVEYRIETDKLMLGWVNLFEIFMSNYYIVLIVEVDYMYFSTPVWNTLNCHSKR